MTSYKHLFQRSIAAAPDRLHFAAHSHHLWPDASWLGHQAAWQDAARLADRKWDRVMGEIWPAAQAHVAAELDLSDPESVVFAGNTHDFLLRILSAIPRRPVRILSTDSEFHSFSRQAARWIEAGTITLETIETEAPDFEDRLIERAQSGDHDIIFVSLVFFSNGRALENVAALANLSRPEGPWTVFDGYHAFMAVGMSLEAFADRVFYLAGGYKYAMSGEGVAIMHAPPGFGPRPEITGWYAAFDDLNLPPQLPGFAPDARRFLGATFDPSGLYRFVAVRDMLASEGLSTSRIEGHVHDLIESLALLYGSTPLGASDWLNPPNEDNRYPARFMAFRHPNAARWQAALLDQEIVTDVRGDVLRIGFGLYHDARDVERLVGALRDLGDA